MTRKTASKKFALVLAEYVARFGQVPPSILTEAGATAFMIDALRREKAQRSGDPSSARPQTKSG